MHRSLEQVNNSTSWCQVLPWSSQYCLPSTTPLWSDVAIMTPRTTIMMTTRWWRYWWGNGTPWRGNNSLGGNNDRGKRGNNTCNITCNHCQFLSQLLKSKIDSNHTSSDCPLKTTAIRIINSLSDNADESNCSVEIPSCLTPSFQNTMTQLKTEPQVLLRWPDTHCDNVTPSFLAHFNGHDIIAVIDEGAEVNVIDETVAHNLHLKVGLSTCVLS